METKNDNKVVYISRGLNQFSDFIPSLQLADDYTSLPIWRGRDGLRSRAVAIVTATYAVECFQPSKDHPTAQTKQAVLLPPLPVCLVSVVQNSGSAHGCLVDTIRHQVINATCAT
jgi:hypothetical protein